MVILRSSIKDYADDTAIIGYEEKGFKIIKLQVSFCGYKKIGHIKVGCISGSE